MPDSRRTLGDRHVERDGGIKFGGSIHDGVFIAQSKF